jgi:hypothetical protein
VAVDLSKPRLSSSYKRQATSSYRGSFSSWVSFMAMSFEVSLHVGRSMGAYHFERSTDIIVLSFCISIKQAVTSVQFSICFQAPATSLGEIIDTLWHFRCS